MPQINIRTIFIILLATIAAASLIAPSGSGISLALLDRTLDPLDGIDNTEVTEITTSDITAGASNNPHILVGFGSSGSDSSSSDSDSSDSSAGEAGSGIPGEGTTPCAAGGSPKVDVRATEIEGLSLLPIWHLFVIYVD